MSWSYNYFAYTHWNDYIPKAARNKWEYRMSGLPFYGSGIKADQMERYFQDYMRNYGITWDKMSYPALAPGAGLGVGSLTNDAMGVYFTSRNLLHLYDSGYVPDRNYHDVMFG